MGNDFFKSEALWRDTERTLFTLNIWYFSYRHFQCKYDFSAKIGSCCFVYCFSHLKIHAGYLPLLIHACYIIFLNDYIVPEYVCTTSYSNHTLLLSIVLLPISHHCQQGSVIKLLGTHLDPPIHYFHRIKLWN